MGRFKMRDYVLLQGHEPKEKLELIFSLAKFGPMVKTALIQYFCMGYPKSIACEGTGVLLPNLEKQINRCNDLNNIAFLISKL
jgi:hypothetical protein